MTNSKSAFTGAIIGLFIVVILFAAACSGPAGVYKPSGLPGLLAFSSDRDSTVHVYTIKPDGTDTRYTSSDNQTLDGLPWWTPDGSRILFTSDQSNDNEIWSMNANGSDRKQISHRPGWDGLARMSPDGSKIVFVSETITAKEGHGYSIFTIRSDGSEIKKLTGSDNNTGKALSESERAAWNSTPTWSPDSSKILFSTNREMVATSPVLYIMNADGSGQQKFGFIAAMDGTEPDWSPVTNKIVFVRGSAAKGEIWVMDGGSPFPGWTAKKITDNADNNHSPVWSPDGTQIAFVSDTYGNENIFIMNADGTNVRRVTYEKSNDRHPTLR
jgi:TolB protein